MSSSKDSNKDSSKDRLSRVVRFAQAEADQALWQAIEKTLSEHPQSNFSELCKQALSQYLVSQSAASAAPIAPVADTAALQRQVVTLQKQIRSLQLQVAKLEGAIGMQQTLALSNLEQQLLQLEQRMTQQTNQFIDRFSQLETQLESTHTPGSLEDNSSSPAVTAAPVELDPLLSRLVPLLEDF